MLANLINNWFNCLYLFRNSSAMTAHRVHAHALFQAVHTYALLNEDDQRKTIGKLIPYVLQPSFCHDHFIELLWWFKTEIRALTAYFDAPFSVCLQKRLAFTMVLEDGRVGMCSWSYINEYITEIEPKLKRLICEWSDYAYNTNDVCEDCRLLHRDAEGMAGVFHIMYRQMHEALINPTQDEHEKLFSPKCNAFP